jgi:arylsulfatase
LHALEKDIKSYDGVYDVGWDRLRESRHRRMIERGIIAPNVPLSPRDPQVPTWEAAKDKKWEARRMAVYAAQMDRMDQGVGRLVESLKRRGRFEQTLILFLSDNGGSAEVIRGEKTRHGDFPRGGTRPDVMPGGPDTYASYGKAWANLSNTPLRHYKQDTHEGGIATPLIAHWPAGITDKGAIRHQVGHVIDLMATAVDLAGAEYPANRKGRPVTPLEGLSLVPAFANDPLPREALFWEHFGKRAVRMEDWKLVGTANKWELYHLGQDRTESRNLAAEEPARVVTMAAAWQAWAARCGVKD